MFCQKLWDMYYKTAICIAGAGPVPVRILDGENIRLQCKLRCKSFAIRVADGHRARPCTSFVVVGGLFHHFHGFSAFLYDHHLAGLSLTDALALEVEHLFLLVVVVYGQVGDAGGLVCRVCAIKSCADF